MSSGLRIVVGVKRVVDYAAKVRVNASKTAVQTEQVKHSMNPFCEIATEEALRLKDAGVASEVIAVSIGPKACADTIRTALGMGCDRGIHIVSDRRTDQELQTLTVAKVFQKICQGEGKFQTSKPDLLILGKQAIDDDCNHTGQMVAARLKWPQATYASTVKLAKGDKEMTVTREIDGGLQNLKLSLPAVITTDLRLNTPRYATLPNIMKAKKKPFDSIALEDVLPAQDCVERVKTLCVEESVVRKAGVKVESVDELVEKLRNEAKVL